MSSQIYLDNSASTRVREEVLEAMRPFFCEKWGNPSSIHKLGRQSRNVLDTARQQAAEFLNASPEELFFTPCGTYSNNVALLGRARFAEANDKGRHIITTCIEHSSSLGPAKHLESRGWKLSYAHVNDEGFVDAEEIASLITPETSIVSLMWANNEIGTVQPIEEVAKICAEKGVFFHSDAVQVAAKMLVDMKKTPVQTLSMSGHKFYAPKGIGLLYVRKGVNLMPIMFGGGQESGLFPGTECLTNIVAIGKACELAHKDLPTMEPVLRKLQEKLIKGLTKIPGVRLTGAQDLDKRVPGHVSIVVEGAVGEELVVQADFKGVCISSVSACQQQGHDPSHVLKCMGFPREHMIGSARITIGRFNTEDEIDRALVVLTDILSKSAKPAHV